MKQQFDLVVYFYLEKRAGKRWQKMSPSGHVLILMQHPLLYS